MTDKGKQAKQILSRLQKAGHEAYFAGGCVRDMLRGVETKDYDIATSATPEEVVSLFSRTLEVGVKFGVVVVLSGNYQYQVATFRSDSSYSDGRHPDSVHFSNAKEDVLRRDFTINGLFYDPFKDELLDYVGGREDIKKKIVRTIGNPVERFKEDRLRMLRAVRFTANLGFNMYAGTYDAIQKMSHSILNVSMERITVEITKMLTGNRPHIALQLLKDTGLLKEILPEVNALSGVQQPDQFHPEGDVFNHTKIMLSMLDKPDDVIAFSVLLHDIGKPKTFKITDRIRFHNHDAVGADIAGDILLRLKFPTEKRKNIVEIVRNHMRFMNAPKMRESTLKKLLRRETFKDEMELHRIDCLASHGGLDVYDFLVRKSAEIPPEEAKPEPLINGNDLIEIGLIPGPLFKEILERVEELQLENEIKLHDEAIEWVKKNYPVSDNNQR